MFSASAEANYMRSMEELDYSLSLNYFSYAFNTISVDLAGYGLGILNSNGQSAYANGQNPYFGIICGDQYISSYDQGAMLIMGLNIELSSSSAKQEFNSAVKGAFGNIFSAATQVSSIASQLHIQGTVVMQAYQMGGEPSQLANILSKDINGDYYALSCSIQNMADCTNAANGLLNYAQSNFPGQFSVASNTGLTPLGSGFVHYEPVRYLGLTPPPSLVNQTIINDRLALASALNENQYYEQKFDELLNGYPVAWDTNSNLYLTSQKLYNQAQNNIKTIIGSSNPHAGAIGCFDYPDECIEITGNIQAGLVPITASDLDFLDALKKLDEGYCTFYFDGSGYGYVPDPAQASGSFRSLISVSITDTTYNAHLTFNGNTGDWWEQCEQATSNDGVTYVGTLANGETSQGCRYSKAYTWIRDHSEFYFTAYNSTDPGISIAGKETGVLDDLSA
jgi:hypothetical protein